MSTWSSEPLMELRLQLGALVNIGATQYGERRMAKVAGGSFVGARLAGTVEPGCVDWQLLRQDGALEMDARYVLHERSGAKITLINQALRHGPADVLAALARGEAVDPASYFYRSFMRFETAAPEFAWLNRTMAVASGARLGGEVVFTISALT